LYVVMFITNIMMYIERKLHEWWEKISMNLMYTVQ